jgi:hypothetical protein
LKTDPSRITDIYSNEDLDIWRRTIREGKFEDVQGSEEKFNQSLLKYNLQTN